MNPLRVVKVFTGVIEAEETDSQSFRALEAEFQQSLTVCL